MVKKGLTNGYECGTRKIPIAACLECGQPHYVLNHCKSKRCPLCYPGWLIDRTERILDRLVSDEAVKRNQGLRLVHTILWWPKDWNPGTKAEYNMKFEEAMDYIHKKDG